MEAPSNTVLMLLLSDMSKTTHLGPSIYVITFHASKTLLGEATPDHP